MVVPPGQVLREARDAARAGDCPRALSSYEHFFGRALQDQGEDNNYYGVRLSYCLDEWARLGEKYPEARERLQTKASAALAEFEATSDPEKCHDYQSIQDHLNGTDLVLSQFIAYHESNQELARAALRFMWDRLVEAKRWDICSRYLDERWYVRDAGNLLGALRNTGRLDAASQIAATVASDMKSRGHPELAAQVGERAAL